MAAAPPPRLLRVAKGNHYFTSHIVCDALLFDEKRRSDTYPYIEIEKENVAASPGAHNDKGERIATDVKVDDTVVYAKYTGPVVKRDGKELLIPKETEVLAVVEI